MRDLRLFKGQWFVGLTRPFLASQAAIEKGLLLALPPAVAAKFGPFEWHKRADDWPPTNPKADPLYRDDWDEWVSSDYSGDPIDVRVPDLISWVVERSAGGAQSAAPPPGAPAPVQPGQYPPTWAQPGSVPVPPLPLPAPGSPPAPSSSSSPSSPSSSSFDGAGALLLLLVCFALSRRRSR
jgi:hypothetical protein